jgi:hypothetical protein
MTEKFELPPFTKELSQPDYREKLQEAFRRPKVTSSVRSEDVDAGWRSAWFAGDIQSIRVLELDRVQIKMWGWSELDHYGADKMWFFQFRKPEDDFLAEARRSQSHGMGFEFGCYFKYPLEPEGPFSVQQMVYYEVWGTPHIRADPMYLPVRVEIANTPLPVKLVDYPTATRDSDNNRTLKGGLPIAVDV